MPLSGSVRVLIVEDVSLIALSLADVLTDEGLKVVGPVATQREALAVLETARPDAAILDLSLQDGFCRGLATELRARGVPFVVYSGHRRDTLAGIELQDLPWIEKPGTVAQIIAALESVIGRGRDGPSATAPEAA